MAYNDRSRSSGYSQNYGSNQRNGDRRNDYKNNEFTFETVTQPLDRFFSDSAKLFLPDGTADQTAKAFKNIPTHQLRKILDQIKLAVAEIDVSPEKFSDARRLIFALLPLSAYNAGRDKSRKPLYTLLKAIISENSLQSCEDIQTLDAFFTSVVAYHKLYSKN